LVESCADSGRDPRLVVAGIGAIVNRTEEGNVDRTKATWFLIAFTVIGILTIIEGVNDGFTVLNWIVIALSVVFALQAVWTLTRDGSSRT
jgi:hypothetical protein